MKLLSAAALAVVLPVGLASAGPLTSERVPDGANFVVHVDFEGMQGSRAGRALLDMLKDSQIDGLDDAREELGFDPLEALHDVTVSGTDTEGGDVVIVLTGHEDLLDALDRLREEADEVREMNRDGVEFLQFSGDHGDDDDSINIWTHETRDGVAVVASPNIDSLVSGVRTFRGRADGADLDDLPRDSFVVVVAHSLDGMNAGPASAVLQLSKGVLIDIGDADGDLSVNLQLHAEDDKNAEALVQMLQGVIAFAKVGLQEEMEAEGMTDVLDGLEFDSKGSTVRLHLAIDPDTLKQFLDN